MTLFAAVAALPISVPADPTTTPASPAITLTIGPVIYQVDTSTLQIDANVDGETIPVMARLHPPGPATATRVGSAWHITNSTGDTLTVSTEGNALRVSLTRSRSSQLKWELPAVAGGTWSIPDGEGIVLDADDPFWRRAYKDEECLGATNVLSLPAWTYLGRRHSVTYAFGDGIQSQLCLRDMNGVQARLQHGFSAGAETVDLFFMLGGQDLLAPAKFYRQYLQRKGRFKSFQSKPAPKLSSLFGAPHAYVWGDGRDPAFLGDLKALGIERILLSYDQNPKNQKQLVGPAYLERATELGYLAGPYEAFDNGQAEATADTPTAAWNGKLYPSGCISGPDGKIVVGFAGRGCEMSSEALASPSGRQSIASRYGGHVRDGASHLFLDVDAFGDFKRDFSPEHPMTMARDRANRLDRMGIALSQFHLVLGSEHVKAWSSVVTHYSHGTAQAHLSAVWPLTADKDRFGIWWPSERPGFFFKPFKPTPAEARLLFGPADRLPLFEAAFHDSVVATDRWEWGLMKVVGEERSRFARTLLYGTPTMWNFDRAELRRRGAWLKAAHDAFKVAHGFGAPVTLTDFQWLTPDRLVQQASYADGRTLIANFGTKAWRGLPPNCVRVVRRTRASVDLCAPPMAP